MILHVWNNQVGVPVGTSPTYHPLYNVPFRLQVSPVQPLLIWKDNTQFV